MQNQGLAHGAALVVPDSSQIVPLGRRAPSGRTGSDSQAKAAPAARLPRERASSRRPRASQVADLHGPSAEGRDGEARAGRRHRVGPGAGDGQGRRQVAVRRISTRLSGSTVTAVPRRGTVQLKVWRPLSSRTICRDTPAVLRITTGTATGKTGCCRCSRVRLTRAEPPPAGATVQSAASSVTAVVPSQAAKKAERSRPAGPRGRGPVIGAGHAAEGQLRDPWRSRAGRRRRPRPDQQAQRSAAARHPCRRPAGWAGSGPGRPAGRPR